MTNQNEKREVYTTIQVSEIFQVSERTILDSIRSGELTAYKRFKKWYVRHNDLMEFITTGESNKSA